MISESENPNTRAAQRENVHPRKKRKVLMGFPLCRTPAEKLA